MNESERILGNYAEQENKRKSAQHQSSGKISPSKLAYPTQTAVLQLLGVPPNPFNDKVLRIFERGNSVERYMVRAYRWHDNASAMQIESTYRNCTGFADLYSYEIIECKSVNKRKFENIQREKKPQASHAIQCCYYNLANDKGRGRLTYVCSDNLQAIDFPIYSAIWRSQVDYRIDCIYQSILDSSLPDYLPLEAWHKSKFYTPYPEFHNKSKGEAEEILKTKYPEAYKKLKRKELKKLCDKNQYKDLIRLQNKSNMSYRIALSRATATSSCGQECVSCSIRHLNDLSIATENSLMYFVPCRRSTILQEQGAK